MSLLKLLGQVSVVSRRRLLAMAALAALANAVALGVINSAAVSAPEGGHALGLALALAGTVAVYIGTQRYVLRTCADEVEAIIARLRCRLIELVLRTDLTALEAMDPARIYAAITGETLTISQAASMLVVAFQAAFVAVFVFAYVGLLSLPALLLSLVLLALVARLHLRRLTGLNACFVTSADADTTLFGALDDAILGLKEIRLDPTLRAAVAAEVGARSLDTMRARTGLQDGVAREFVFMQVLCLLLLAVIVFVVPSYNPGHPEVASKVTTAILFVAGSLGILLQAVPAYARAEAAAHRLGTLQEHFAAAGPAVETADETTYRTFRSIRLHQVAFAYPGIGGEPGFRVGPIDLEVRRGDVVFLVGGNGCGKSTLLKLLAGLYRPAAGEVLVDAEAVLRQDEPAYRALFSIVLADFHLFDRLYGIDPDLPRLEAGLGKMGLRGKTRLEAGRFATLALSAGQRKRLAMLVAEQEARPIIILDEWTAEQDPEFRRFFYHDLVPAFRARGITVISATHDDQYFQEGDRVLGMDSGQLVPAGHGRR